MIEIEQVYKTYEADGEQREWTFPYPYVTQENISLYIEHDGTLTKINPSLYQFSPSTSKVTYPLDPEADPVPAGDTVLIWRETDITQEEDSTIANFKSNDVERMVDKLTMICQELSDKYSRAVHFEPTDVYDTDATTYVKTITDARDIAIQKAGESSESAEESEASSVKAKKWAEGTDQEVASIGGTHSSKGWANIAQAAAESEAVQTVAANIEDVNTVAGIQSDVTQVASIAAAVSNVSDHDTEVNTVYDNLSSVITTANNINDVKDVASIKNDVVAVSNIKANVTSVAGNASNINAVAGNATNINTVAADKTNIDAVAGNATNINTVATNISDVNDVADDITKVSAVANDLTAINAVNNNKTNIDTVSTNISNVTSVATAIADVSAVADDLTNIDNVADDLTNIDTVAASLPDIQDKQNKVLTNSVILGGETQTTVEGALEAISEEWVKPSDWVDIRSGALGNSIYLLVAHSAPTESGGTYTVANYAKFSLLCQVSTSANTYDVYVDGVKVATTAHNTNTTLDWGALYTAGTVQTLYTTTHPSNLVYHIVRITPSVSTDTLTRLRITSISGQIEQGLLWIHYQLTYAITISSAFASESSVRNYLLEAVTAVNDTIKYTVSSSNSASGFYGAFNGTTSLKHIPTLVANSTSYRSGTYLSFQGSGLKRLVIKNNSGKEDMEFLHQYSNLETLEIENPISLQTRTAGLLQASGVTKLKNFPAISQTEKGTTFIGSGFTSLQDTFLDLSFNDVLTLFRLYGVDSNNPVLGLKGLIVSSSAPFDGASPQIDVSHTGMNRAALITLFNSMPYNAGYTVVGSPTITDGVASGFSANDYLRMERNIAPAGTANKSLKVFAKFTTGASLDGEMPVCGTGSNYSCNGLFFADGKLYGKTRITVNGVTSNWSIHTEEALSVNTTYYAYIYLDIPNKTFSLYYSTDNSNWITITETKEESFTEGGGFYVYNYGHTQHGNFNGSIDMPSCYAEIDGVLMFVGRPAMTKTCSIVGCTGTADLTADDKAIATGKGWELTVA